jgi:hypothetical protein
MTLSRHRTEAELAAEIMPVDNTNSAMMFDNSVGGNMLVLDNTGLVDVVGNAE